MSRQTYLQTEYVELIPSNLENGKIYISEKYSTAIHLCCCGCGLEVVTPLNLAKWTLTKHKNAVSIYPSIGNWSFPCRSHYWIRHGRVEWSYTMSTDAIEQVRKQDKFDAEAYALESNSQKSFAQRLVGIYHKLISMIRMLFKW